jgi:hypothetical protein
MATLKSTVLLERRVLKLAVRIVDWHMSGPALTQFTSSSLEMSK